MKSLEELKARFASIQPLPISEEMLGTYLEGNLTPLHCQCVENLMAQDDDFATFVDDCNLTEISFNEMERNPFLYTDIDDSFSLPELPIEEHGMVGFDTYFYDVLTPCGADVLVASACPIDLYDADSDNFLAANDRLDEDIESLDKTTDDFNEDINLL